MTKTGSPGEKREITTPSRKGRHTRLAGVKARVCGRRFASHRQSLADMPGSPGEKRENDVTEVERWLREADIPGSPGKSER
jgi:hypothetical protein